MEVTNYITEDGKEPFAEWIRALRDREARTRILKGITRMRLGNFGDSKSVGGGVSELRLTYGLGYRVYYAKYGDEIVFLLCGGTKERQSDDIEQAKKYWSEYKARTKKR
jgi:putative addiction module killer protein